MSDGLPLYWVHPSPSADPEALLADLRVIYGYLGHPQLAKALEIGSTTVPAAWLPGLAGEPGGAQVTLAARPDQRWSDEMPPVLIEDRGWLAELVIVASPTGSCDMTRLDPLIQAMALVLDPGTPWETETRGGVSVHHLPSGWALVETVEHASHRYGIGES